MGVSQWVKMIHNNIKQLVAEAERPSPLLKVVQTVVLHLNVLTYSVKVHEVCHYI